MPDLSINTEAFDVDNRDRRAESSKPYDNSFNGILSKIPQLPQRQDSGVDQLKDLQMVANKLGMYDAADFIKNTLEI